MIVDGYTTPLTSGNFVDLVKKGFMMAWPSKARRRGPDRDPDGPDGPLVGHGDPVRRVPLEPFVDGDKAPTYGETTGQL